ncbi:PDZ domain-containing protein [Rubripirellula amarantea]|nr:PDZ domain-containing protein [Rubripirellula amarantea]
MWAKLTLVPFCILFCTFVQTSLGQDVASESFNDQGNARLGIEVTDSPGIGVRVGVVAIGGPADYSGIRPGDYVLRVNGKPIDKPEDLIEAVRAESPGGEVVITVWHDGQESDRKIVLATADRMNHRNDRAWLGVTLEPSEGPGADGTSGAKIEQVIPGSPAAQSNLKAGDVVVAINGIDVESSKDLVNAVEGLKPGETATLKLVGDPERERQITLGSVANSPPLFSYRMPIPELNDVTPDSFLPPTAWRDEIIDLRRQVQELRDAILNDKVDRPGDQRGQDEERDQDEELGSDSSQPDVDDSSSTHADRADYHLVVHRPLRRGNRAHAHYPTPAYRYSYGYQPNYGYWYDYGTALPYSSYYRSPPVYRQYYRRYYRPSVRVYVGPVGGGYYYR